MPAPTQPKILIVALSTGLAALAMLLHMPAPTAAATTTYAGIETTWDPQDRTITQDHSQQNWGAFDTWLNAPIAYALATPPNEYFCPDCPDSWAEVDQLIMLFPKMYRVTLPAQIFDNRLQVHLHTAAKVANGPDLLVQISVTDPSIDQNMVEYGMVGSDEAWNRSYHIVARGKTLDFGSDGRPDLTIHADDWNVDGINLGAGNDLVDLRGMTNVSYPKHPKYPLYYQDGYFKGCRCGPGDDSYWGNLHMGQAFTDMGPGDDRAWVVSARGGEVVGGLGDDILHGGPWQDHLYGGDLTAAGEPDGKDRLYGHGATDKVWRYSTHSREPVYLNGGAGSDWIDGGLGNDTLVSGGGRCDRSGGDSLRGNGGHDRYIGDACTQRVTDFWGRTIARLFAGHDTLLLVIGPRHQVDCGEGSERFGDGVYGDWTRHRIPGACNCELYGQGRYP